MSQINDLLRVANAEIGVAEDPRGSNRVKFNTAYYGREVSGSAYPWCMVFVWWCFRESELSSLFYGGKKTASCTALMRWAMNHGQWITEDYRRGDVLLFQFDADDLADHVGILERVEGDRYITVEGNTNDEVRRVTRKADVILGAWRPQYQDEDDSGADGRLTVQVWLPEISYGDTCPSVIAMQTLLMGYGYSLPQYGADGEYGAETEQALLRFQALSGLEADGICGEQTWKKLLGVGA